MTRNAFSFGPAPLGSPYDPEVLAGPAATRAEYVRRALER